LANKNKADLNDVPSSEEEEDRSREEERARRKESDSQQARDAETSSNANVFGLGGTPSVLTPLGNVVQSLSALGGAAVAPQTCGCGDRANDWVLSCSFLSPICLREPLNTRIRGLKYTYKRTHTEQMVELPLYFRTVWEYI
jgi:hypothetical protein